MTYLIVECIKLCDQWECDADRIPLCVVKDYSQYNKLGYEIYEILADGNLRNIKDYDERKVRK